MTIKEANSPVDNIAAKLIEGMGLKQQAVAQKAGYSKQALSDMLNGRKVIKVSDISKLSVALGVTPNDLFTSTSNPHAH